MRNTKQGSSGNLVWTSISDGVIRQMDRFQSGVPEQYREPHMPVLAKLVEMRAISMRPAAGAPRAETKPNVRCPSAVPLHLLSLSPNRPATSSATGRDTRSRFDFRVRARNAVVARDATRRKRRRREAIVQVTARTVPVLAYRINRGIKTALIGLAGSLNALQRPPNGKAALSLSGCSTASL
jgi:hypothetical protein